MWHAEVTVITLRLYAPPNTYAAEDSFIGCVTAKSMGHGVMWLEGGLRSDGTPLSTVDWRDVGRLLRDQHGTKLIRYKHKGALGEIDTSKLGR